MSENDDGFGLNRRELVRSAGIGGISLAAVPGMGSARGEEAEVFGLESFSLVDGMIDNSQDYRISTQLGSDLQKQIDSRGERVVTDVDFQRGIEALNDAKRQGHVEFTEEDDVVQVALTGKGRRAGQQVLDQIGGEAPTTDNGVNKFETNPFALPPNIKAYTDDDTTEKIIIGTATVAALLSIWGVTGNVPAAIAGIILGLAVTIISTVNDGHGVVFIFYVNPVPPIPTSITPTIRAQ